jgi:hypothetical protein
LYCVERNVQSVLGVQAYQCKGPYGPDFAAKTPGERERGGSDVGREQGG